MLADKCARICQRGSLRQRGGQLFQPVQHLGRRGVNVEIRGGAELQVVLKPIHPGINQERVGIYGFVIGSAERSSARRYSPTAAGMRISWERFSADHVT